MTANEQRAATLPATEATSVAVNATASLPVQFDFGPNQGDPDLPSSQGTSPSASYTTPTGNLTNGFWFATPSEIGPYPSGAPAGTVSMSMSATFKAFDHTVTSDTGDLELASTNPATTFSPVVINPGQSATVNVTITPSGSSGSVVSGFRAHTVRSAGRPGSIRPPGSPTLRQYSLV